MSNNNNDEVKTRLADNRRKGHEVPSILVERRGSASFADEDDSIKVFRLSHAERVKTLLNRQKTGYLSTIAHEDGSPFGSIVNFAVDSKSELFFVASKLAEHTANLEKDNRCSLLISEEQGEGDKLATQRATIVGKMERVEKSSDIISSFKARHPTAAYVMFDDFFAYKFHPVSRVRFIAGFGEMSWVKGTSFDEAKPDPISSDVVATKNAIDHMNSDHADANLLLVNKFATPKLPSLATSCVMLSIDRYGMDMLAELPNGKKLTRVNFPIPLRSSDEVKNAIVVLTRAAKV